MEEPVFEEIPKGSERSLLLFSSDDSQFKNFEFNGDTLLLDIRAENNPNLSPGPIWSAELRAVWNLKSSKFTKVDFKPGEIGVRKPED